MKKSMIFAGVLCIGYASAQTEADYDGKVGINTDKPTATIQVKSKTGWSKDTKNLELTNAADKQLVTVLDNGNVGIQAEPTDDMLNINDRLRYNPSSRSLGLGISSYESQWARGYNFVSKDGATLHGGFQAYGTGDNVKFYYVGKEFTNPLVKVEQQTGNVGIALGNTETSEKLDVNGNARVRELPNNAGGATDKVVVVDNTGVLKSVDRSTITSTNTTATNGVHYDNSMECNADNVGKINYVTWSTPIPNPEIRSYIAFCMQSGDEYVWTYIVGGSTKMGTRSVGSETIPPPEESSVRN